MTRTRSTELERLYTVREVAKLWNVSERTVRRLIGDGELEAHRIKKAVRITPANARRYLERVRG